MFDFLRRFVNSRRTSRVWTLGYRYALPIDEQHHFNFSVSFPTEEQALLAISWFATPGVEKRVEVTPNKKRWASVFETTALPKGDLISGIVRDIHVAAREAGQAESTVVATASLPGSGAGFLLHIA